MNNQTSLSRYILVILCISIVFTALVLIALNSWVQNKNLSPDNSGLVGQIFSNQSYDTGYKAGYLAARETFKKVPPLPDEAIITSLTGTVMSVEEDRIIFKAENLDADELIDGVSSQRTAITTASTTFVTRSYLSPEDQARQLANWSDSGTKDSPPLPYTEKPIKLSEIKPGQKIAAMANINIRFEESFEASKIILEVLP